MGIYRGTGGTGDSTTDATVTEVTQQATNAAQSASDAASSASSASSSASTATTKASEAATSAANAAASESSVAASATTATTKAAEAATSATNAATSETNAATSATSAATSATSASTSATTATTKASEAATSATSAATSATNAATSATSASTAQTAAETAQTAAETAQTGAETAETNAASSATSAASSATSASTSASTATTKASEASTSATNAATSATNAATSETNAANSATSASTSASTATTKASEASTSASNASTSETNAATSATTASNAATSASTSASTATTKASEASSSASSAATSASNASTSETNAATSETNAATSASNASTSATNAATSETNASNSATSAATSATNASTSATSAATSATSASTSATNASNSASSASTSATAAESAKDAALAALDSFDDRYLGTKTSDPTVDNDGNALVAGALYFNTTDDVMKVYEGSTWVAAYASLSGALLVANNLSDLNNAGTARTNLGLGTAATTASTDYATASQGTLADSAVQPGDNISGLTNDSGYVTTDTTYTAGSGLSLTGTTFANTAPDQTVTLTGSGATTVSGTYPNFTISSTDTDTNTTYSAGTGLTLSGTTFSLSSTANADTVDSLHASSFLRSDAADTATGQLTFAVASDRQVTFDRNIATPANYYNGLQVEVKATSGTAGIGLHRSGYSHCGIYHDAQNSLKFNMNSGTVTLNHNAGTLWGSGNDGSGSGLDADTVDGIQGASFLRSDADDTVGAGVTYTWSNTDTHGLNFVNSSYGTSLYVGGWDSTNSNNISRIRTSSGNLHIDSAANGNLYLNWYSGGVIQLGSAFHASIFYDSNNTGYYADPASTSRLNDVYGNVFRGNVTASGNGDSNAPFRLNTDYSSWVDLLAGTAGSSNGWGTFWAGNDNPAYTYFSSTNPNEFVFVGAGSVRASIDLDNGQSYFGTSVRSPIFYDSANTGYYIDPASTSVINDIYLEGAVFHNGDTNTYHHFHAADNWRVVAGGSERFEVNNTLVSVNNAGFRAGSWGPSLVTSATFTPSFSNYNIFLMNLATNVVLLNSTTGVSGQTGLFVFYHYNAARTVSLGSYYQTVGGAGLTLSTTSGVYDVVPYVILASGSIKLGNPILGIS